ncbi:reverse transcriptase domain-containing protein [Tanacetum coccineum]|uniref:Reverse transcriptase domain-containing protein n=1 Tax=Tanacetum coccineum TaxID=301880 RepID=A0ABQ5G9I0_9ASTR
MRPPGFNQPNVQNNQGNQSRYQGNNFNSNQNRGGNFNQGQVYQPPTNQPLVNQAYQAPIPQIQGVSKTDFDNYVKANDAVLKNVQNQGQNLQNQMANVTSLLTSLCNNFNNSASTSKSGTLPSQTVTNPREHVNAITTRSGKTLEGPSTPIASEVSTPQKEPEQNPETSMDKVQKPSSESTAQVPPPEEEDSIFIEIPKPKAKKTVNVEIQDLNSPRPNSYQPKLPYPERMKVRENDKPSAQHSRFLKMFKQLRLEIGLKDALVEMPKFNKWLSSLLRNKEKLEEIAITTVNAECSAIIMNKVPEKLEDPGKFLIPCALQELDRTSALADSGASINLLPHSIYKQLGLGALKPTRMTLELANCSITHPMGIAEDVVVRVDGFTFLADFVVVNFEPNPRVPIILGRPFLRTAKALIDLYEETLTLRVGKEELVYYADKSEKNKEKKFVHAVSIIDFSKDDPFSGSTTIPSDAPFPSFSPMKTSDSTFEEFIDEFTLPNSLPPGNDDSIHKKDIHEEIFSNPLFEFDDNFKSSNVNPLFEENDKDVEIKSSSSFTLTSPEESEFEAYLERDSIPPGIDLTLPPTLEVSSSNPTSPTLTGEKVCSWKTPMFFSLVRFVWKMMKQNSIRKKIICLLATYLHQKPKPLSRPQEVEEIKEKEDEVSSDILINTIVMPIKITFDNPIDFNHFSKPKDFKKDLTISFDSTKTSIFPPPLLDSDSPFTAELSASITLNSLGNEDKVFKPEPSFPRPPPEPPDVCMRFQPILAMKDDFVKPYEDFYLSETVLSLNVEDVDSFTFIIWTFLPYFTYPEDSPLIFSFRSMDISKITRKQSKTGKHGHGKWKSTKEAKDSKPKPRKDNYGQAHARTAKLTQDLFDLGLSCDELYVKASSLKAEKDRLVGQIEVVLMNKFKSLTEQRWILGRGLRLVVMKCLQSPEYLAALGGAIGHAIDKGMQDGLAAGSLMVGKFRINYLDVERLTLKAWVDLKNLLDRVSAQSVGSSNTDVLDSPCLLVLITGTSQSRQRVKMLISVCYYLMIKSSILIYLTNIDIQL